MDPFLLLTTRLFETIAAHTNCLKSWGIYLLDKDFDNEPELRNKLGTIWISSLLDTLEADYRFIPEIEKEAAELGFQVIVRNCQEVKKFCSVVADLLNLYTREEQLFILAIRHQLVHGYINYRHREIITVKYSKCKKIVIENIMREEYHKLLEPFYESSPSLDQTLKPLIDRALNKNLRYWQVIHKLIRIQHEVYDVMRKGGVIRFSGLDAF